MTLFEYLAIAFGLIYSVTALRLLGGLSAAIDRDRRYWVHLTLIIALLLGTAGAFWTTWSLVEVQWTFPRFLVGLGVPAVLYFNASTLVPANPDSVASWRDHYYRVRLRFFGGIAAWSVVAVTSTSVNLATPWRHPSRVVAAAMLVVGIVGVSSGNPRVHEGLAAAMIGLVLVATMIFASSPGWLAAG